MSPVAVDVSNQADASREVMQGLFKDLGKQAMALEAILRVVCGKVDRMESWITAISFGMSELDLKLRNIAHNIDGTSAVDEDAGGTQPWGVPPPDDDVAGDRVVARVSKKIGKNSKMHITGMAASIIDKLSAEPRTPGDKASKKKKAVTAPTAETPKKGAKKKMKSPSQHHQQAAVVDTQGAQVTDKAFESEAVEACSTGAAEVPPSSRLEVRLDQAVDVVPTSEGPRVVSVDVVDETSAPDSERSTSHSSPREMLDPIVSSAGSSVDSTPVHSSRDPEHMDSVNEVPARGDQEHQQVLETLSSAQAATQEFKAATTCAEEERVRPLNPTTAPTAPTAPTDQPTPTTASQSVDPSLLPLAAQEEPVRSPAPTQPVTVVRHEEAQHLVNVVESPPGTSDSAFPPVVDAETTQTSSTEVNKPRRSLLIGRVLELDERKLSQTRRSDKKPSQPDVQTSQPPSNSLPAVHHEAQQVPQQELPLVNHNAPPTESPNGSYNALETSRSTVEDDAFDSASGSEASQEAYDDVADSSVSSSSDSDDADDSNEQQQQQQVQAKDASASSSAASILGSNKRTSLVAGSTISRTMTALKKLKKANMLTPEEEEELKQRAQEKWYKLKGHVKEKQKKEVANILLKRKKNVFTVSSRLELLEEKSKELFAAIKTIGNDLKLKTDLTAHESLRRQVADLQRALQNMDVRLGKMAAQITPEKVTELGKQLDALRAGISDELGGLRQVVDSNHTELNEQIAEQREKLQIVEEQIPDKLAKQAHEFELKLQALPDFGASIEALQRGLRRKADLKMLKELEARLLGHTLEDEDCLVRCLSCHKEVTNLQQLDKDGGEDEDAGFGASGGANQLRRVNPGPSSAKIYRSNVPFSAEPTGMSSGVATSVDSSLPSTPTPSESKPVARRVDTSLPKASPISRLAITSASSPLSPDRPISAPATAFKKKSIPTIKTRTSSITKAFQDAKE